jgi:hypothetical protein
VRCDRAHSRDSHQALRGGTKGRQRSLDLRLELGHGLFQLLDKLKMLREQEAVMTGDFAVQRFGQGLRQRVSEILCSEPYNDAHGWAEEKVWRGTEKVESRMRWWISCWLGETRQRYSRAADWSMS